MSVLKNINGDYWPSSDKECHTVTNANVKDLDAAISQTRGRDVAIQAGGNCGVWPRYLAGIFKTVYTFEPDPDNFMCLNLNARAANIIKLQAALGLPGEPIALSNFPANVGAHRIDNTPGRIPMMSIDQLNLTACDMIQIDIEGYECFALCGGRKTIMRFKPVLMIEDKGHEQKYGVPKGEMKDMLKSWGYNLFQTVHRDIIMIPGII